MRATPSSPRSITMSVAPNSWASFCRVGCRLMMITRSAPSWTRSQHTAQTDRAVTDDGNRHARLHAGRDGGVPAGAHHVGQRQQARDEVVRRVILGLHQGAVRQRYADPLGLAAVVAAAVLAGGLETGPAVRAGVVGGEEAADDEPAGLDVRTASPTSSTMPQYSWPIAHGLVNLSRPRYGHRSDPQTQVATVRTTRRWFDDRRVGPLLEADVTGGVQDGSAHLRFLSGVKSGRSYGGTRSPSEPQASAGCGRSRGSTVRTIPMYVRNSDM